MKTINKLFYKEYKNYKIKEISSGDLIQINSKGGGRVGEIHSTHIQISRKDPTGSGRIIGKGIFDKKGEEYLFHVDYIFRNYTLDPITSKLGKIYI